MNTTPAQATEQHVDEWVLRRVELDEIIARANEEKQTLNTQLAEKLGDGTHETRHAKVVVSRRGTLDQKRLEADYPATEYPQLYATTTRLDTGSVKDAFAPSALEQYKTYSAPSVTIK